MIHIEIDSKSYGAALTALLDALRRSPSPPIGVLLDHGGEPIAEVWEDAP